MWGDIRKKRQFKCLPNFKQRVSWGWSTSLETDCLLDQKSMLGQLFKDNALKLPYSTNSYVDIYDSVTIRVPVFAVGEVTRSWLDISDFVCRNVWRWRRWTSTRKTNPQVTINYQFSSVTQSCPTLCDPMVYSTPGLPVHHQLPEFTQTHVHRVGDAIQPSHPLSSFSSLLQSFVASGSFQTSQLFASGGQSIGVSASTSVLPMTIQDWFPLGWIDRISLQTKGLSRVFSNTTVQKHQFFGAQLSLSCNSHIHTWLLEKP